LENDRAAYRVAADLDPFETKAAAGAIRESMAIFMFVIVVLSINEVCMGGGGVFSLFRVSDDDDLDMVSFYLCWLCEDLFLTTS